MSGIILVYEEYICAQGELTAVTTAVLENVGCRLFLFLPVDLVTSYTTLLLLLLLLLCFTLFNSHSYPPDMSLLINYAN